MQESIVNSNLYLWSSIMVVEDCLTTVLIDYES